MIVVVGGVCLCLFVYMKLEAGGKTSTFDCRCFHSDDAGCCQARMAQMSMHLRLFELF